MIDYYELDDISTFCDRRAYNSADTYEKMRTYIFDDQAHYVYVKNYSKLLIVILINVIYFNSLNTAIKATREQKHKKAIELYDKVLEISEKNTDALVGKGVVYANMGAYVDAIQFFEKALEINPTHPNAAKYLERVQAKVRLNIIKTLHIHWRCLEYNSNRDSLVMLGEKTNYFSFFGTIVTFRLTGFFSLTAKIFPLTSPRERRNRASNPKTQRPISDSSKRCYKKLLRLLIRKRRKNETKRKRESTIVIIIITAMRRKMRRKTKKNEDTADHYRDLLRLLQRTHSIQTKKLKTPMAPSTRARNLRNSSTRSARPRKNLWPAVRTKLKNHPQRTTNE